MQSKSSWIMMGIGHELVTRLNNCNLKKFNEIAESSLHLTSQAQSLTARMIHSHFVLRWAMIFITFFVFSSELELFTLMETKQGRWYICTLKMSSVLGALL